MLAREPVSRERRGMEVMSCQRTQWDFGKVAKSCWRREPKHPQDAPGVCDVKEGHCHSSHTLIHGVLVPVPPEGGIWGLCGTRSNDSELLQGDISSSDTPTVSHPVICQKLFCVER